MAHRNRMKGPLMHRRDWLARGAALMGAGLLGGCHADTQGGTSAAGLAQPAQALRTQTGQANSLVLSVDLRSEGVPVNRQVLGQNLQWVDRGDEVFDGTARARPEMLSLARQMGCTVLRYPGGLQSDTYRWERGMGLLGERGLNEHANARSRQSTLVGTQEFLELCESLGATPMITVNIPSATEQEAADWVKLVNVTGLRSRQTGKRLPRIPMWELGNEPYLKPEEQPKLWLTPSEFAQRARRFALAMLAADPTISLSLPLTTDLRNGHPITPMPGFTREVLKVDIPGVTHFSLHNAYVPFGMERTHNQDALYWGAMAGGRALSADLQGMRALLKSLRPTLQPRFAITEFNSLFTLGRGETDQLPKAPVGALAVAELLRVLSLEPDVDVANFWSLSGNGFFGAIHPEGWLRPAGHVLAMFSEALRGRRLSASMQAPSLDTPSVGASPQTKALPLAESLVTLDGSSLRAIIVHKDPANPAQLDLNLAGGSIRSGQVSVLHGDDAFNVRDTAQVMTRRSMIWPQGGRLSLPPCSVALVELDTRAST